MQTNTEQENPETYSEMEIEQQQNPEEYQTQNPEMENEEEQPQEYQTYQHEQQLEENEEEQPQEYQTYQHEQQLEENEETQSEIEYDSKISPEDCVYEISDKENIMTKIEKNTNDLKNRIKISNKIKNYLNSNDKYEPNFLYMLEDPTANSRNQISFSEIKENKKLEKCQLSANEETPEYYLCKYKKVETISIEQHIKKNRTIFAITDIHNVLLESVNELSKNAKIVNLTLSPETVTVSKMGMPIIKDHSNAFDSSELSFETLNIIPSPDETKCVELHILFHIGNKRESQETTSASIFTESDMNEIYSKLDPTPHPSKEQIQSRYINKNYQEVYEKARESIDTWDVYSVMYMFWKILGSMEEMPELPLSNYKSVLEDFLRKEPNERANFNSIFERIAENKQPHQPSPNNMYEEEPQQNTYEFQENYETFD